MASPSLTEEPPRTLTILGRFSDANIHTRGEVLSAHGAVSEYEGAVFFVSVLKEVEVGGYKLTLSVSRQHFV